MGIDNLGILLGFNRFFFFFGDYCSESWTQMGKHRLGIFEQFWSLQTDVYMYGFG